MRRRALRGVTAAFRVHRIVTTLALVCAVAAPAAADPRVLRVATVAPAGSAWAREMHAWARDVEHDTNGDVRIKMFFGASFGGEDEMELRVRRGQLDGVVSGGMLCSRAAPSLRVMRVLGLTRDRHEAVHLLTRLGPKLDREFVAHGFVGLGVAIVGIDLLFTRGPLRSLADMQGGRYWIWDLDDVVQKQMAAIGVHLVPAPLWDAATLYDGGKVDGFSTVPGAAVAFQWWAQARHATPLDYTVLTGCAIVSERAFNELSPPAQKALRAASLQLQARFNDLTETQDQTLLDALFARQGLVVDRPSARFRAEFATAAEEARRKLGAELVPPALLQEATQILADYRAHR